jgi:AcrR family transcriptional regulator
VNRPSEIKMRDREATCRRLTAAVGSLLARKGFKGIGVNSLAREAGVDKKLIYRYFGGLNGVIAAFGREGDFWPSPLEMAGGNAEKFAALSLEQRLTVFSRQFIRALRRRPMTLKIMAWEMVASNELTRELEAVREQGIMEFVAQFFSGEEAGPGLRTGMMLAGAAISYLLIRSEHIDVYGGLHLDSEVGWQEIESGIDAMIRGMIRLG